MIDIRFRLSSPKLRAAAEAKLLSDNRAFFDKKRRDLNVPAIKLEVLPVPAYELRIYIQDPVSGLTLASAQVNPRNWTKDVTLSFRFNKESLAAFLQCEKEGTLQFTPYYKARAEHYAVAKKQTTVNYAVGLKVKQLLDHRQRSKLKNEDENTILPILQGRVSKIARDVGAEINSEIIATDPAMITFLHSDTMLVSSCFDPANTLSFDEFRKAFRAYTDDLKAKLKDNEEQLAKAVADLKGQMLAKEAESERAFTQKRERFSQELKAKVAAELAKAEAERERQKQIAMMAAMTYLTGGAAIPALASTGVGNTTATATKGTPVRAGKISPRSSGMSPGAKRLADFLASQPNATHAKTEQWRMISSHFRA